MKHRFRWTTDKKPKDYEDVLVTVSNDETDPPERIVVQAYYAKGAFFDATFNTEITDVVAWTQQPEPYREDIDAGRTDYDEYRPNCGSSRKRVDGAVGIQDDSRKRKRQRFDRERDG